MTPAPKQPGYGYLTPAQSSPDYPQYPQPAAPFNPQPFDINALFKILGVAPSSTTGSSGMGTGGIGGPIGATPHPLPGKGGEPVGTYNPGFLGMPMPITPQGPLPDISTMLPAPAPQMPVAPPMAPPMAPQMPVAGMTPAPTPPQMPIRAVEDPYSTTPDLSPGMQRPPAQGLDIQKLLEMLRAMQGRRVQQPQPPRGGEGAPRMGPSPTMRGSGMGLEGILQGIEASKQSSR